jgi:hypothetical protein
VRRKGVEMMEYERGSGVGPICEGDLFALDWASGFVHGS